MSNMTAAEPAEVERQKDAIRREAIEACARIVEEYDGLPGLAEPCAQIAARIRAQLEGK